MRPVVFSICFLCSVAVCYFFRQALVAEISSVVSSPPTATQIKVGTLTPSTRGYLVWDPGSIIHNGFTITNSLSGLSVSRNGQRLMFIKNETDGEQIGQYGLKSLLGNG